MEPFIIDCSFALAWCFLDERTPRTDSVQAWLKQTYAVAPPLWRWEVARRHRYPLATLDKALASAAASLGIQVL